MLSRLVPKHPASAEIVPFMSRLSRRQFSAALLVFCFPLAALFRCIRTIQLILYGKIKIKIKKTCKRILVAVTYTRGASGKMLCREG